jgi:hypothetical protein
VVECGMRRPLFQFRLSTLLWITLAVGVFLWMLRPSESPDVHLVKLVIVLSMPFVALSLEYIKRRKHD